MLLLLGDIYELFSKYKINTSTEDFDLIDGLSFSYQNLITQAKEVSNNIFLNQLQWKIDLINGISTFRIDLELFDEGFDDISENVSAKVAKDKVCIMNIYAIVEAICIFYRCCFPQILLMDSQFNDMLILNEIFKDCSKLFGLEYKENSLLKSLKPKIENIVSCSL